VIINLLTNAIDAALTAENPQIKIEARKVESVVQISVSNSGPLIPESLRKKIMEPFLQPRIREEARAWAQYFRTARSGLGRTIVPK